jgi:hypothetical protein
MSATIRSTGGDRTILNAEFHIRLESDDVVCVAAPDMEIAMMDEAIPWRTVRWYFGQCHYSGAYWSATKGEHVIYESRLELSRLLLADFDPAVSHIVAQPFLIRAKVDGAWRRHIPDYFLVSSDGATVVDVKPHDRLDDPKVIDTFAWVREVVEAQGWRFEVASELPPTQLANTRRRGRGRRGWLSIACWASASAVPRSSDV